MSPAIPSLLTIAGSAIAAYYGAYFKRRGEDKAIAAGFTEVLRQTRETTEATKAIEAKINDDVWARQRQWEAKRDVLFECTKQGIKARGGVEFLQRHYSDGEVAEEEKKARDESRAAGIETFNGVIEELRAYAALAELMCRRETTNIMYHYASVAETLVDLIIRHTVGDENYIKTREDLWTEIDILRYKTLIAIRYELGIPELAFPNISWLAKPQSSESSAAPSPGSRAPE